MKLLVICCRLKLRLIFRVLLNIVSVVRLILIRLRIDSVVMVISISLLILENFIVMSGFRYGNWDSC